MKKIKIGILWISLTVLYFFGLSTLSFASTTDTLYTEINQEGNYIDGNRSSLAYDKPVIRPSYVGSSILNDYIGPNGDFGGFWGEQPPPYDNSFYGHEYSNQKKTVIRNVGYYQGQKIALKLGFTNKYSSWTHKVTLTRDGGLNITPDSAGLEFQLVYDDGVYTTPVQNVYVELPVLSQPTSRNTAYNTYSFTQVKASNLKRLIFNQNSPRVIDNLVTRNTYTFSSSSGGEYRAAALRVENKFEEGADGRYTRATRQTFIFDNVEPLVLAESTSLNISTVTTLFKSDIKTPGQVAYLPPRTNGSQNTDKFEANFDITQALNDGYPQYFPESLHLVMEDDKHFFKEINLAKIEVKDSQGNDISNYVTIKKLNEHQIEFQVQKEQLLKLGSNQINLTMSVENLDSEAVLKNYSEKDNVFEVPVTFYNYRMFQGKKYESEKMIAVAKITPNIYGEPADNIEADQYMFSGDLDKDTLLKNLATTIPGDTIRTEMVDTKIYFKRAGMTSIEMKIISETTNKTKIVSVPVNVKPAELITSQFFESQRWLIDEINRQLAPKQIDLNVYRGDLYKIKEIFQDDPKTPYTNQHIPKNIGTLKNLTTLVVTDKQLVGEVPTEVGNLDKLTWLILADNKLTGKIPESVAQLKNLERLNFSRNKMIGSLPNGLDKLTKLNRFDVFGNSFVGIIPSFPNKQLASYTIRDTQLTYNDDKVPDFLDSLGVMSYSNTLVNNAVNVSKSLKGGLNISLEQDKTKIKPFNQNDSGFFDLHLLLKSGDGKTREELFDGHTYKIISLKSKKVVYQGLADENATITVDMDETFQVIMDGADKNPNNVIEIESKKRELKLEEIPDNFSLDLKLGDLAAQTIKITSKDNLIVYDNRLNSQWQLRMKPTQLTTDKKILSGTYLYGNSLNTLAEVPFNQFKVIEKGQSEPVKDRINISEKWNTNQGLFYKQATSSDYQGSYTGKIEWQIADVPTGN